MKVMKRLIALMLLAAVATSPAWADHRRHLHWGVTIGSPYWAPWGYYYAPPSYYYPPPYYPPVIVERQPPVYIERPPAAAPAPTPQTAYWYYCNAAQGYYPYVKECPSGWSKVLPQPAAQP